MVQGNIDDPGNVARGELGGRADVDELCVARRLGVKGGNCDGWRQNFLLLRKSGRERKRIQGGFAVH